MFMPYSGDEKREDDIFPVFTRFYCIHRQRLKKTQQLLLVSVCK